jgi:hypothetical protein
VTVHHLVAVMRCPENDDSRAWAHRMTLGNSQRDPALCRHFIRLLCGQSYQIAFG